MLTIKDIELLGEALEMLTLHSSNGGNEIIEALVERLKNDSDMSEENKTYIIRKKNEFLSLQHQKHEHCIRLRAKLLDMKDQAILEGATAKL